MEGRLMIACVGNLKVLQMGGLEGKRSQGGCLLDKVREELGLKKQIPNDGARTEC